MLCIYCRLARPQDNAPCLNCGAPSSSLAGGRGNDARSSEAGREAGQRSSGLLACAPSTDPLKTAPPASRRTAYGARVPGLQDRVYAPNTTPLADESGATLSLQLLPDHALSDLLPEQVGEHGFVAIPPIYTKPRPLVPSHRIVGGFLSVLIVCILLCAGSGYYVQSSSLFAKVSRIYTNTPPRNIPPTVWAKLPDPPEQADKDRNGPALSIIPSATTAGRYDPKTYIAVAPQTRFTTQQIIYLTFSVQTPKEDGRVAARWYTNNKYFLTQTSNLLKVKDVAPGSVKNGFFSMHYMLPAEGKVELYWNNQWAQTLYFVVNA